MSCEGSSSLKPVVLYITYNLFLPVTLLLNGKLIVTLRSLAFGFGIVPLAINWPSGALSLISKLYCALGACLKNLDTMDNDFTSVKSTSFNSAHPLAWFKISMVLSLKLLTLAPSIFMSSAKLTLLLGTIMVLVPVKGTAPVSPSSV